MFGPFEKSVRALLLGALLGAYACVPGDYVAVDYEPEYAHAYAYTTYDGAPVYYVRDHWYRRHGDGWVYYRTEPEELHRYRMRPRTAPPAYSERHRHEEHEHHDFEHAREEAPPAR